MSRQVSVSVCRCLRLFACTHRQRAVDESVLNAQTANLLLADARNHLCVGRSATSARASVSPVADLRNVDRRAFRAARGHDERRVRRRQRHQALVAGLARQSCWAVVAKKKAKKQRSKRKKTRTHTPGLLADAELPAGPSIWIRASGAKNRQTANDVGAVFLLLAWSASQPAANSSVPFSYCAIS